MKVYIQIKDKTDLEIFNIFKSVFLYLNNTHEYFFEEPKEYDAVIHLDLNYLPLKSIEPVLENNHSITLSPNSEYVYSEGNVFLSNTDKYFSWFKYPIRELLTIVDITPDKAKYIMDLNYLIVFGSLVGSSAEFISKCQDRLKLIIPNKMLYAKTPFTYSEIVTAKQYGIDLVYKSLGKLTEPTDRSLINKNICFACVTSVEYTEPTYVFLHSMFKFNDIKTFKVYFVNGSTTDVERFQNRCKKISNSIEVIQYSYHTEYSTVLHFNRDYVDSKMSILDELTPIYDLTVMCDCDMLCQGNLKNTLMYVSLMHNAIYGVKDILAIFNMNFSKATCYINGGFIIYKKGSYSFQKRYDAWKSSDIPEAKGMYNEQDFINYVYYAHIQGISAVNNFTAYHKQIEPNKPIIYHYPGPTKPFQNVQNETCNTINKVLQGLYIPYIPVTMYFELYRNYVNNIKEDLDPLFIKQLNYLKDSPQLKMYDKLICQKCISTIKEGI